MSCANKMFAYTGSLQVQRFSVHSRGARADFTGLNVLIYSNGRLIVEPSYKITNIIIGISYKVRDTRATRGRRDRSEIFNLAISYVYGFLLIRFSTARPDLILFNVSTKANTEFSTTVRACLAYSDISARISSQYCRQYRNDVGR